MKQTKKLRQKLNIKLLGNELCLAQSSLLLIDKNKIPKHRKNALGIDFIRFLKTIQKYQT